MKNFSIKEPSYKMKPLVSTIIRTYNEEEKIGGCLEAVFNQKPKPDEVIIVDSGSTDRTLEIIKKFPVKILKIRKKDFTYGKALNIGCEAAKGKYLVLLSAHALPIGNDWLAILIKNLKNKKVAGVFGKEIPAENCNPLTKRRLIDNRIFKNKNKKVILSKGHVFCNPDSAIRKDIWKKIKFDEKLIASEDHDWAQKVHNEGYSIVYEPKAAVIHSHNETLKQIYRRTYREMYAYLLMEDIKICIRPILDVPYNIYRDIGYVIKNNCELKWILRSFVFGFLYFAAILSASLRRLIE